MDGGPETKPSFRRRAGIESVREGGRRAQSARRGRFSIGAPAARRKWDTPDGAGAVEAGVRRPVDLLGRRLRRPEDTPTGDPIGGGGGGPVAPEHLYAGRRICFRLHPRPATQHPPRTSSRCTTRPSDSGNKGINPNWTEKPTRTCPGGLKCDGKKGILVYGRLQR